MYIHILNRINTHLLNEYPEMTQQLKYHTCLVQLSIFQSMYENEKYTLKAGDIFFIPANHAYSRYPIDNQMCTMTYIHFSLSNESIQLEPSEIVEKISNSKLKIDNQILDGEFYLSNQSAIYLQNWYSLNNHEKILIY